MSLLLLFNQPPADVSGVAAAFYLISGSLPTNLSGPLLALPARVTYEGGDFLLAIGYLSRDDHDAMLLEEAQPAGWTGTVSQARRLLRENDLIHMWWIFDWFASVNGATGDGDYRAI